MRERTKPNFEELNVLIASPYSIEPTGGVQKHIQGFGRFLIQNGHYPMLFSPTNPDHPEETVDFANKRYFVSEVAKRTHNGTTANIPKIALVSPATIDHVIRDANPDIIHGHDSYASIPALQLILQSRLPLISPKFTYNFQTFHASHNTENLRTGRDLKLEEKRKKFYKNVSKLRYLFNPLLDGTIVVSPSTQEFAKDLYPRDHRLIPNGIETERFTCENRYIERLRDGKLNILYIGRLEARKGVHHLLETYATVKKEHQNIRLIIAGDGPQRQQLEEMVNTGSIKDVEFLGRVEEADLPKLYKTADICAFFATHGEAQGLVLLEAMSSGVATIAGNNSGYRTVIKQAENGLLVTPTKVKESAETLKLLIENGDFRKKVAEAGLRSALNYDWKVVGPQIIDYYTEQITKSQRLAS